MPCLAQMTYSVESLITCRSITTASSGPTAARHRPTAAKASTYSGVCGRMKKVGTTITSARRVDPAAAGSLLVCTKHAMSLVGAPGGTITWRCDDDDANEIGAVRAGKKVSAARRVCATRGAMRRVRSSGEGDCCGQCADGSHNQAFQNRHRDSIFTISQSMTWNYLSCAERANDD